MTGSEPVACILRQMWTWAWKEDRQTSPRSTLMTINGYPALSVPPEAHGGGAAGK